MTLSYRSARDIVIRLKGHYSAYSRSGMARCPAHDDRSPSLSVTRAVDGRVLVHCHAGCTQSSVIDALRRLGLWDDREPQHEGAPDFVHADRALDSQAKRERRERAQHIWDLKTRDAKGTVVESYLRARGISVIGLSDQIRFAMLPYHHDGESRRLAKEYPCMVARLSDNHGLCAIQRTYLDPHEPKKADVPMPKKTLGAMDGGAVRLRKVNDTLGLAEGIETAISASQLYGTPVWATLSVERFKLIEIPKGVEFINLFADKIDPTTPRERERSGPCVDDALALYEKRGYSVDVIKPAAHFEDRKDFNDVVGVRPRV